MSYNHDLFVEAALLPNGKLEAVIVRGDCESSHEFPEGSKILFQELSLSIPGEDSQAVMAHLHELDHAVEGRPFGKFMEALFAFALKQGITAGKAATKKKRRAVKT